MRLGEMTHALMAPSAREEQLLGRPTHCVVRAFEYLPLFMIDRLEGLTPKQDDRHRVR